VSLDCSPTVEGSTHRSLDSIPFGILLREKFYNGVSVCLRIRSHPSVYPGVPYTLTLDVPLVVRLRNTNSTQEWVPNPYVVVLMKSELTLPIRMWDTTSTAVCCSPERVM
jgi:hypothetical protein